MFGKGTASLRKVKTIRGHPLRFTLVTTALPTDLYEAKPQHAILRSLGPQSSLPISNSFTDPHSAYMPTSKTPFVGIPILRVSATPCSIFSNAALIPKH
jgi:hypothetical protein